MRFYMFEYIEFKYIWYISPERDLAQIVYFSPNI